MCRWLATDMLAASWLYCVKTAVTGVDTARCMTKPTSICCPRTLSEQARGAAVAAVGGAGSGRVAVMEGDSSLADLESRFASLGGK